MSVVLVVLPIFLLIFLGHWCRRRAFPGDGFWAPAEKLTYFLFFPMLLATTIAKADFTRLPVGPMALALLGAILAMALGLLAGRRLMGASGPAFTSVFQGSIRSNTYIGIALALAVHGGEGLAAAALAVACLVPSVNLLSVFVLSRHGSAAALTWRGLARQVASNPLILACLLGAALNLAGLGLPPVLGPMMEVLSRAALPLGLLAVGAALDFSSLRGQQGLVAAAVGLKLVLLPGVTATLCWALEVQGAAAFVAIAFNALPTATSSYILARQLGGDAPLMAAITTLQTFASMATLPLLILLLPA